VSAVQDELAYGLTFDAFLTAIISLDFLIIKRNVRIVCPKVVRSVGQIIRRCFLDFQDMI